MITLTKLESSEVKVKEGVDNGSSYEEKYIFPPTRFQSDVNLTHSVIHESRDELFSDKNPIMNLQGMMN